MAKGTSMGERYKLKRICVKSNVFYRLENNLGEEVRDANKFLEDVALQGNSEKTAATYGYDLLHFFTWLDESNFTFENIKEPDLYGYIMWQREKNAAPRSINHRLSTVMQFYKFCFDKEMPGGRYMLHPLPYYKGQTMAHHLGILPRRKMKRKLRVKVSKEIVKPLEAAEVNKFIQSIGRQRDLAIVYLMLYCGLRSIEVLRLKSADISYFKREILVRGKGNKERIVYLPEFISQVFDRYHRYERPEIADPDHIFVALKGKSKGKPLTRAGLREIFRYRRAQSGVKRANPHRFRHTCGADLARAHVSLRVIQKLFGHDDINQTAAYTNISQEDIKQEVLEASQKIKERYGQKTRPTPF